LLDNARVVPHERTFKKYRTDRERLLKAVRANTSPVFMVFPDRSGGVRRRLARLARSRPLARAPDPWGGYLRLWAVEDAQLLRRLAAKPFLVADGHHRLRVCQELAQSCGQDIGCLVYLVADEDPGLLLLPTHRVVARANRLWRRLQRMARFRPVRSLASLDAKLQRNLRILGVYYKGKLYEVRPIRSFAGLPVEWVSRRLGLNPRRHQVRYTHEAAQAVLWARRKGSLALLLPAPRLRDVRRAVLLRGLLPEKSTYFYPKVPTGLVFRELPVKEVTSCE